MYAINFPTPWSIMLLEKLLVAQLVKTQHAFYGTGMFITMFTGTHLRSLF